MGNRHYRPLQPRCHRVDGQKASLIPAIVQLTIGIGAVVLLAWTGLGVLKAQNTTSQVPAGNSGKSSASKEKSGLPGSGTVFPKDFRLFAYEIDPNTPVKELLPATPKVLPALEPWLGDDLSTVPEVSFEDPTTKADTKGKAMSENGMTISKINALNKKKQDGFLLDLLANRPDLQGLSFLLGNDCKMKPERQQEFKLALDSIRQAITKASLFSRFPFPQSSPEMASKFAKYFDYFDNAFEDAKRSKAQHAQVYPAGIAALMQVFGPDTPVMQVQLVKHLAKIPHVEATRTLTKLALFYPQVEVRDAAIEYLKLRREKDFIPILLEGFRYPWPELAHRANYVLAKLQPGGVVPEMVNLLEEPDPRLPQPKQIKGKEVYVAKQLVRINHHKNCLLCHAPATSDTLTASTITAPIPLPGEPLRPLAQYYSTFPAVNLPELSVRVDVTYLRQDFSLVQKVPNAKPWPELQRFDFLVRSVQMTKEQADAYGAKIKNKTGDGPSPYQTAVLSALHSLTGQKAGNTAPEWRKALKLPG